jgi:hypothetical protein
MRFELSDAVSVIHAHEAVQNISPQEVGQFILRGLSEQSNMFSAKYLSKEPECSGI